MKRVWISLTLVLCLLLSACAAPAEPEGKWDPALTTTTL